MMALGKKNDTELLLEPADTAAALLTKQQILNSKTFRHNRDLLNVLLVDDGLYTVDDVIGKIEDYMKGTVN